MNLEELNAIAQPIVEAGFANDESADDIKMNMMGAGIPFSKLNSLLKSISIAEGLMVDPKTVTDEVNAKVESIDWEAVADWAGFAEIAEQVSDAVDGASVARVVTLARSYAKNELDLALPKKPRSSGGGKGRVGAIAQAVVDLISVNNSPTKQEFYDAMVPVVGGDQQHANIIYYMGLHQAVAMAIASGESLASVTEQLAQQANPEPGEGVSATPRGSHSEVVDEEETEEEEF